MTQLQKYTWLIETIRRAGKISHRDLSDKWERCKDLSDFVMKLLQTGAMIEVIEPMSLRKAMKGWICEMNELYKND